MFGYEHERVCFARIGECDGGMYATFFIVDQIFFRQIHNILRLRLPKYHEIVQNRFDPFDRYFKFLSVHTTCRSMCRISLESTCSH